MRKISMSILGLYIGILSAFTQNTVQDSAYKDKKIKIEEVNLVSSYYTQDGNNSAVTGGIGTEALTDFSNTFDIKFSKWTKHNRQHNLTLEMGFDAYSSASSDKIDYNTISSPSYNDERFYPSISWSVNDPKKRTTIGATASYSTEWDYESYGSNLSFSKTSADNNQEFGVKLSAFFDKWLMILPEELRPVDYPSGSERTRNKVPQSPRNSYSAAFTWSTVVNERLQLAFVTEPSYQTGQLATPYQRVYFTDKSAKVENLPTTRWKLPIGVRASYFVGDRIILRPFYRFYADQWGLIAHTLNLETAIKLNPYWSISPSYRFYAQNALNYFAAFEQHNPADEFYTSDFDLSKLNSHAFGTGVRWVAPNALLGAKPSVELRYNHYIRSTKLTSDIISVHLKMKF